MMEARATGDDRLLAWIHGPFAVVRVSGRGSYKVGAALREFGGGAFAAGAERLVLDLDACVGMDSTFMGVVAGLALKARNRPGARVVFVNLGERNRQLLVTLGLSRLVDLYDPGKAPEDLRPALAAPGTGVLAAPGTGTLAETMLRAHEDLVRIDPENLNRFRDVLEFLHRDVGRRPPGGGPP
jgi:anti-anti-sigma regulatory factor